MNLDLGKRAEREQVGVLPLRRIRIISTRDARGEVFDLLDSVSGREQQPRELNEIEPPIGRALYGAVVEIEAVHIDVRSNRGPRL